jgi:cell division protein ZapA (FtsZ GTPase activity inhibitor)
MVNLNNDLIAKLEQKIELLVDRYQAEKEEYNMLRSQVTQLTDQLDRSVSSYSLRVDRDDEERIRKAAKLINDKVLQYKQRYNDKDVQDFLAMAALQYVIKTLEMENNQDATPLVNAVSLLDQKLEKVLTED